MPLPFGIEFKQLIVTGMAQTVMYQVCLLLPILAALSLYIGGIWVRLQSRFYFLAQVAGNLFILIYEILVLLQSTKTGGDWIALGRFTHLVFHLNILTLLAMAPSAALKIEQDVRSLLKKNFLLIVIPLISLCLAIYLDRINFQLPAAIQEVYIWTTAVCLATVILVFRMVRHQKNTIRENILFAIIFLALVIASFLARYHDARLAIFAVLPANLLWIYLLLLNHRQSAALEAELRSGLLQENQNLRIENQMQHQILRYTREAVLRLDRNDCVTYCNVAFEKLTALALSEIMHSNLSQVASPDFLASARPVLKSARRGSRAEFEVKFTPANGDEQTLVVAAEPLFDSRQKFNGTHLGFIDATELTTQRDALDARISQQEKDLALFRAALARAEDALVLTDHESHIVLINEAFTRLTGFTADDLLGQRTDFYRLGRQNENEVLQDLLQGKNWHGRRTNKRKDGSRVETSVIAAPIHSETGNLAYILWTERDAELAKQQRKEKDALHEKIRAQETAYRELEEQFEIIFSVTENGIIHLRPDGRCAFMNKTAEQQLGYAKDELPIKKLPQFVNDLLRLEASYGVKMEVRMSDYLAEFTRPNGKKVKFRWRGMPVWNRKQEPMGVVLHIFPPDKSRDKSIATTTPGQTHFVHSDLNSTAVINALLEFSEFLNTIPASSAVAAQFKRLAELLGWPRLIFYRRNNETAVYESMHTCGFVPKIARALKSIQCAQIDQYMHSRFAVGDAYFLSQDKMDNGQKNWAFTGEKFKFRSGGKWQPCDVLLLPLKARGEQAGLLLFGEPDSGEYPLRQLPAELQKLARILAVYLLRKSEIEQQSSTRARTEFLLELTRRETVDELPIFAEKTLKKLKQVAAAELFILAQKEPAFAMCSQAGKRTAIKKLENAELDGLQAFFSKRQNTISPETLSRHQMLFLGKIGWKSDENVSTSIHKLIYKRQHYGYLFFAREAVEFSTDEAHFFKEVSAQLARLFANSRLIGEIESKAAELEIANALISEFLANVSHELRTPLHAILSYVELMRQKSKAPEKERARHLETIRRSGKKLLNLINDLLDLSKIEAGKIEPNPVVFSPRELLQHIEEEISPLCRESGLALQLELDTSVAPYLRTDSDFLERILLNLTRNAQKYTETGSVSLSMHMAENGWLVVKVCDTGVGIPEKDLPRIFEPFQQLPGNGHHQHKGSGLGLAISKSLVDLLQGTISVESEPGEGTEFTIAIPVQSLSRKPRRKKAKPKPGKSGRRTSKKGGLILLVDDDESTREAMRFLLENAGYRVEFAGDGEKAITLAQHLRPQLILLDIMMPGIDGLQTTRILKSQKQLQQIPVIALTARAMQEDRLNALEAGCDDFLSKPFEMETFLEIVEKYV